MLKSIAHWARQALFPRLSLAHLAAVLLLTASALANVRYGLELGQTDLERFIAAGAALGADLWSAVAFIAIAGAASKKRWGQMAAGVLVTCVTLIFAVNAGIGFAASTKEAMVGQRAAIERSDKINQDELKRIDARIGELKAVKKPTWRQREEQTGLEAARPKIVAELKGARTLAPADPAGESLASYLAKIGVNVDANVLRPWQTLLFVLLVVLGGPLALWMAESRVPDRGRQQTPTDGAENKLVVPRVRAKRTKSVASVTPVENRAVKRLAMAGGKLEAKTQSELAKRLGLPRTSYRRVVDKLEGQSVIETSHGREGYKLRLVK